MALTVASGDSKLDNALQSLRGVNVGDHKDSGRYTRMNVALSDLESCLAKYTAKNNEPAPTLTQENISEIKEAYSNALRRCNDYTRWKWTERGTGYGQGRLKCVNEIQKLLERDFRAIKNTYFTENLNLNDLLIESRISDISLKDNNDTLKTASGNSTTRIPLSVKHPTGHMNGFFTESAEALDDKDIIKKMRENYDFGEGRYDLLFSSFEHNGKITDKDRLFVFVREVHEKANKLHDKLKTMSQEDFIADPEAFSSVFRKAFFLTYCNHSSVLYDELMNSKEKRAKFLNFFNELSELYSNQSTSDMGEIYNYMDIPKRNVGMYRVANLMGMGNLIAKAYTVKVTDQDGNVRDGVFQETVNFSDSHRIKKGDPILEIGKDLKILNNPKVLMQISDLQVLDYVCGNNDRHEGNIMYDMQNVDGKWVLNGIKGIDNDRSFGLWGRESVKKYGFYVTDPLKMKVIRRSTFESLQNLSIDTLKLALQDLNFDIDEYVAACDRKDDILKLVEKGKIEVVDDEYFNNKTITELSESESCINEEGKQYEDQNTFSIVKSLNTILKMKIDYNDKPVNYNDAEVVDKEYIKKNNDIYACDLASHKEKLKNIRDILYDADSSFFINNPSYKWMETAINDLRDKLESISINYPKHSREPISKEDSQQLDSLYRQLREASNNYILKHENPSSPHGKARRTCADELSEMWPPCYEKPMQMVKAIDINAIIGNDNIKKQNKKKSLSSIIKKVKVTGKEL